jgi:CO/xanthine dehydrogenase FAD-binding subunit
MSATYHRPEELRTALELLAQGGLRIAAGCTDLFPATEAKILPGKVLDITGIAALRGISAGPEGLRIGAATTWTDLLRADLPPALAGLQLAAREVGGRQIQNRGTLAGNLCNASPAADGVPPLLTLDARVELQSLAGQRSLPLSEFLLGPRQTALAEGELVRAILLPAAALGGQGAFRKLGARRYLVISIAMCAARLRLEEGRVAEAALAVGACGPVATRLPEAEAALIGQPLDPSRITDAMVAAPLAPIGDMRADAPYRAEAAAELLRRTLADLAPSAVAA